MCSRCGAVNPNVTLGVKEWTCPTCGAVLKRDPNAAVNIREEGKRIFIEYMTDWIQEDKEARKRAADLSAGRKKKKAKAG